MNLKDNMSRHWNNRDLIVDIIRGFMIIFVVVGHTYFQYKTIIYWFHMPAFFMLSGFLLKFPGENQEKEWIKRKSKSFLIPYCVYAFITGLFEIQNGIKQVAMHMIRCLYGGELAGGVYWFITVLLISEIALVLIRKVVWNKKIRIGIYVAFYVIAILESVIFIPANTIRVPSYTKLLWDVDVCLIAIPYLAVGMGAKEYKESIGKKVFSKIGIFVIALSFIVMCVCFYFTGAINWFAIDLKYSQYKNVFFDMASPIIAIAIIILISKLIQQRWGGVFNRVYWGAQSFYYVSAYTDSR